MVTAPGGEVVLGDQLPEAEPGQASGDRSPSATHPVGNTLLGQPLPQNPILLP